MSEDYSEGNTSEKQKFEFKKLDENIEILRDYLIDEEL